MGFRRSWRPNRRRRTDPNSALDPQHRASQTPRLVPGRIPTPHHTHGRCPIHGAKPLAARTRTRRTRGQVPLAEQNCCGKRSRVGQLPRCLWLLRRKGRKARGHCLCPLLRSQAGGGGQRPVYLASQFYGAGQVFYIGSGELWRLRGSDPAYFEVLYTKLIRHVSQGRILRGSSRGSLLVERDHFQLGETVVVRARLSDAKTKPLTQQTVAAQLLRPDGNSESIKLSAETERPGMFIGQATVLQEGTYQLALSIP